MGKILQVAGILCGTCLFFSSVAADESSWTDRISLKGDLRLRYEGIDEEFEVKRERMRYRARLGLSAVVTDEVKLIFSLASGADNPVSRNVTFGDSFASDDFGLELAYVVWTINDTFAFYGGKMKNPLYRAGGAPLIYDSDLNPEGFALAFDTGTFFGSANLFLVEERSSADNTHLYAAQAGMRFGLGENGKMTAGIGYFGYSNTIGNTPFFNGNSRGNTVDVNGDYVFAYENAELFAAYDFKVDDLPLSIYGQLTQNGEVSRQDTAYAFGARLGSAKSQGTWQAQATYMDVEADAVIGTFNDSDFAGANTQSSGYIFKGKYMVRDQISLGGALFVNKVDRFSGVEHDYTRIQLDVEFKFD